MGLLSKGQALSCEETRKLNGHIRKNGVLQFVNLYKRHFNRQDSFKWGDEIEYTLIQFNEKEDRAQLLLQASELLPCLQGCNDGNKRNDSVTFLPEFCEYQLEATPAQPYGHHISDMLLVEENMKARRKKMLRHLKRQNGETVLTVTIFPRLGCPKYTFPEYKPKPTPGYLESLFVSKESIGAHPRYSNFMKNIQHRLGRKPAVNMPIFKDKCTPCPFREDLSQHGDNGSSKQYALDDHVYFDTSALFGISSLQVTFQGRNIAEARHLYDQMSCVTPILLALSAASPFLRGYLLDTDARCDIIGQAVDERTDEERGLESSSRRCIAKSRYGTLSCYLSPEGARYNDTALEIDEPSYHVLRQSGVDEMMAQHIAHLFIRDSLSMFAEHIHQDNLRQTDLFENIQSTNWHNMRFKPPPSMDSDIGWRVEFRPLDIQLTEFENAAFATFVILLSRTLLHFNLSLLIPISKADMNWKRAQKRNAVLKEKFFFRQNLVSYAADADANSCLNGDGVTSQQDEYAEMTVNEIMNGKENQFPGLIPLVKQYLGSLDDLDVATAKTLYQYLNLLEQRANGRLKTAAHWMRDFVRSHTDYRHDSLVSDRINYDLLLECERISLGTSRPHDFLPPRYALNTDPPGKSSLIEEASR